MAQLATASMGKFDRKVHEKEPDAKNAMKQQKIKKLKQEIHTISKDKGAERDRNLKVLNFLQREQESKASSKADAHLNSDKMAKHAIKKDSQRRETVGKKTNPTKNFGKSQSRKGVGMKRRK